MPDELGLLMQIFADRVPSVVIAITAGEDNYADFHSSGAGPGLNGGGGYHRSRLFSGRAPFFDWRRPVALLECADCGRGRQNDRSDEFLLTVLVKFDYKIFVAAGNNRAKTELGMFNLGSGGKGLFGGHGMEDPLRSL